MGTWSTCLKHRRTPARGYAPCAGCEVEHLQSEISRLQTIVDRLAWIQYEYYDLRCVSVPTGGDDYHVEWVVISHHMAAPCEREVGRGRTAIEAIEAAEKASAKP